MRNQYLFGVAAIAMVAAAPAMAQETTSTINGTVTSGGNPVSGASVIITHIPSGTRAATTTNSDGSFDASGLRIGGPFTVNVNDGEAQITDVYTTAGQAFRLPIELAAEGGEIVVTASKLPGAGILSQGPITILGVEEIANVASVNRDIRDLSRRDPFARLDDSPSGGRSISFAGQNPRYNRFSVDGVPITDNFGLNNDGLPSRRSPIPLDAIGQFQAKVAPYDVRDGNFQGGAINIVLRSGTNDFQGKAFFAYSDQSLTGKKTKAGPGIPTGKVTIPDFTYKNYGLQLSGPIIKDKLFFMIAGERVRAPLPVAEGPTDNNAGTAVANLSQAQVDQITSIAKSKYGYDTGGVLGDNGDKDDRLVARLDANLSDTQRASLTFTYAKDEIALLNNTTATGTSQLGLASNAYIQGNELYTGVFQLNSEWSDSFSTEFRGFYKDYTRIQDPLLGRGFAQMSVCLAPTSDRAGGVGSLNDRSTTCQTGFARLSFGPDSNRQTNQLNSQTYGGLLQGRLTMNDHDVRVFADIQKTKIFNSFLPNSAGSYYFDSIADFQAGNAQSLAYGNAIPSLNPDDGAASFNYYSYTFGVQDVWKPAANLTVSYGARYDVFGGTNRAVLNPAYQARYGFANSAFISGRGIFQPRFGLDWKPVPRLSIRGGLGIFSGGTPDVYVSNSFSNTGVLTNAITLRQNNDSVTYSGASAALAGSALSNVNGTSIPSAANTVLTNATVSANAPTASLDPNFKIPSQWRATLSATYDADLGPLGDGWEIGGDVFYSTVRDQVYFRDLRVTPTALKTPDGRTRYASLTSFGDTNSDILLTNSKLGRSWVYIARLRKAWDFGLEAGLSYTHQDIKDANPATSSIATSNYGAGVAFDPNGPAYGVANDEVRHAFKYDVKFEKEFFGDYKTVFALFGETRIGRPYSYTFRDTNSRSTVFGTVGTGTRYLMYVPTGINDPLVSFGSAADAAAFDAFVTSSGLGKYRGKVAPRNAFNSKWFTRLDLHMSQEIPAPISGSRFTVFADVENFTNLLNKKWGQIRENGFPYTVTPAQVSCLQVAVPTGTVPTSAQTATNTSQACAQYRYTANQRDSNGVLSVPTDTIYARQSLYTIRVGVKFEF